MKLEVVTVPNPETDPAGFVSAVNTNLAAIETAIENAAFRTGDTMEADLVLDGGVVANGTVIEGEPPSSVVLLLHFDEEYGDEFGDDANYTGEGGERPIIDSSPIGHEVVFSDPDAGNTARCDDQFKKFGGSSYRRFYGKKSEAGVILDPGFYMDYSTPFTLDMWWAGTVTSRLSPVLFSSSSGDVKFQITEDSGDMYLGFTGTGGTIWATTPLATGTEFVEDFVHVAVSFDGQYTRLFQSGLMVAEVDTFAEEIYMDWDGGYYFGGIEGTAEAEYWIDELRLVVGEALFTENFTPPVAPYGPDL